MEILELKITISEMKNSQAGVNSRFEEADEKADGQNTDYAFCLPQLYDPLPLRHGSDHESLELSGTADFGSFGGCPGCR